eukprot:EG_transcript_37680
MAFASMQYSDSIERTSSEDPIKLPKQLRGYVRYIVVLNPEDGQPYSVGVKYVCNTEGAQALLTYLTRNVNRKHKKHVHSWLCQSVVDGSHCELGDDCPNIHVTPQGYNGKRKWLRPLKGVRDLGEEDAEVERCFSMETDTNSEPTSWSSSAISPAPSIGSASPFR